VGLGIRFMKLQFLFFFTWHSLDVSFCFTFDEFYHEDHRPTHFLQFSNLEDNETTKGRDEDMFY
jgi:hypothetical protein